MEKAIFDNLILTEQVDHINNMLAANDKLTVTQIIQGFGKSKKHLSKIKAAGFTWLKAERKYILTSILNKGIEKITETYEEEELQQMNEKELKEMKEEIKKELKDDLENDLQDWKNEMKNSIRVELEKFKSGLDPLVAADNILLNINYDQFKGDIVTRSFRIYDNILADFTNFCNENKKQHKAQALLSQALLEFMTNHKDL